MTLPAVYTFDPDRADDLAPSPGQTAIYGLFDPRDQRLRYIGKSKTPRERLRHHTKPQKQRNYRAFWLMKLADLGLHPLLQIIAWVVDAQWQEAERSHIAAARACGCDLANLTDGGDGAGGEQSSAARRAIWARLSAEERARRLAMLAEAGRKAAEANKGQQYGHERCARISAAKKKYTFTPEHRANIGRAQKGRPPTARQLEGLRKGREAPHPWAHVGHPQSAETRAKISAYQKGRSRKRIE